jgi:hypothetical protein
MDCLTINIAEDFSRCPGARYPSEGDFSGEEFRKNILKPKLQDALESGMRVKIILDGSAGYSTAFLEEAFGGLVREDGFTPEQLEIIDFVSEEDITYIDDIKTYIEDAAQHS